MNNIHVYKNEIEKEAAIGSIASKAVGAVAKGAKSFAGMGAGKRMLAGSALGGTLKGATHDGSSGKSRMSSIASGALTGGLGGLSANTSNLNKTVDFAKSTKNKAMDFMNNK